MFWFLIFFSKRSAPVVTIHLTIAWPMEGFNWHVLGRGQCLISSGGKLGLKEPCVRLVCFWVSDASKCLTNPFGISLIFRAFNTCWRAKPVDNPSK